MKNSEKWKIYGLVTKHNANANDNIHACATLQYTDVNDNIHNPFSPESKQMIHEVGIIELCGTQNAVRPDVWSKMGKAAQKEELQDCANEQSKLDNAQRQRGISFIDLEDGE